MQVTVLAFATASDIVGKGPREISLDDDARLSDLKAWLIERHPSLAVVWPRLAVAVGGALVRADADPALSDGVEVALLPPVSGGLPSSDAASSEEAPAQTLAPRTALVDGPIDIAAVRALVEDVGRGAVLTFLGSVRNHHQGRSVLRLDYSAYHSMAEQALTTIVEDLASDGVSAAIHHRLGSVPAGEVSVVIAVASAHRDAAYAASRTTLERLKKEVPIWKHEYYGDGQAAWREEESLTPLATSP